MSFSLPCGNSKIVLFHRKEKMCSARATHCTARGAIRQKFCKLVALLEQGECSASDEF